MKRTGCARDVCGQDSKCLRDRRNVARSHTKVTPLTRAVLLARKLQKTNTIQNGGGRESEYVPVLKTNNLLKTRRAQNAQDSEFGESVYVGMDAYISNSINSKELFELVEGVARDRTAQISQPIKT
jgi:hypothetical protein